MNESPSRAVYLRVGVAVLLAVAVLVGALVATGPLRYFSGHHLAVDYGYAGPVKPGAAVRISGMVVGAVERVEFLGAVPSAAHPDALVRVHLRLDEQARPVVTERSRFYVTTLGVLGEHYVDIIPDRTGTPLAPDTVVRGVDLARSDLLLPRAAGILEAAARFTESEGIDLPGLVERLSGILAEVDRLLKEQEGERMLGDLRTAMQEATALLEALRVGFGDGTDLKRSLATAPGAFAGADTTFRDLRRADLEGAIQKAGPLLERAPPLVDKAEQFLDKADRAVTQLDEGILLDGPTQKKMAASFLKTFVQLERIGRHGSNVLVQVDNGEGAIGEAFQDRQLVLDLKAVLRQLRRNPAGLILPFGGSDDDAPPQKRKK